MPKKSVLKHDPSASKHNLPKRKVTFGTRQIKTYRVVQNSVHAVEDLKSVEWTWNCKKIYAPKTFDLPWIKLAPKEKDNTPTKILYPCDQHLRGLPDEDAYLARFSRCIARANALALSMNLIEGNQFSTICHPGEEFHTNDFCKWEECLCRRRVFRSA